MPKFTVDATFEALARFGVRHRFAVAGFWLVAVIATSAALPSLASQVNNPNSAFLLSSAPSSRAVPYVLGARQRGISKDRRAAQIRVQVAANAQDLTLLKRAVGRAEGADAPVLKPAAAEGGVSGG